MIHYWQFDLASGNVPQSSILVIAGGGQQVAIWGKGHVVYHIVVVGEGDDLGAVFHAPDTCCLICPGGGQQTAVLAKDQRQNIARMPRQNLWRESCLSGPQPGSAVAAAGD